MTAVERWRSTKHKQSFIQCFHVCVAAQRKFLLMNERTEVIAWKCCFGAVYNWGQRSHPVFCSVLFSIRVVNIEHDKHFVEYLEGIEGAAEDEQAVVSQWGNHSQVGGVADEVDLADARIVMDHLPGQRKKTVKLEDFSMVMLFANSKQQKSLTLTVMTLVISGKV